MYWVITLNVDKLLLLTNLDNREYIISVKSIVGRRKTIPPMLILYKIYILEKWAKKNNFDKNILLVTTLTKYSNTK